MNKVVSNIALIGCGRIAKHHCRAIKDNKKLNLSSVCDIDFSKAEKYSMEFGSKPFSNYHEMLKNCPEIDTVAIITPSGMHYEHSLDIVQNYNKNIIVEKPTYLKCSQFKELHELIQNKSLKLFSIFQNRHNKAVQRVKKAIENNELGDIRLVSIRVRWCRQQNYYDLSPWRGTFAMDGGCLTNQGIHHLDLMRYLGGEVVKVHSIMGTMGAKIEVEDTVVGTVEFKNKAFGSVEITTSARPEDFEASISIVASKGLAQIGGIAVNELQIFTPDPDQCALESEDFSGCIYGNGHYQIYREISHDLENLKPYSVKFEDAFSTIQLLNAFYVSNEENKSVNPKEIIDSKYLGQLDDKLAALYRTKNPKVS